MNHIFSRNKKKPSVTALEGTRKSLLRLLVLGGASLVLARLAWVNLMGLLEQGDFFVIRTAHMLLSLFGVLLVVFVFQMLRTILNIRYALLLDESLYFTHGEVIDKWIEHSSDSHERWIDIRYLERMTAKARLRMQDYGSLRNGDEILIEYPPDRAHIIRVNLEDLRSKPQRKSLGQPPTPLDLSLLNSDRDE